MQLAQGIDKKVGIMDCECYEELFDVGVYDPEKKEWIEFEVSYWKDQLYEFVAWYTSKPFDYIVTYNGIGYDQQVLQYIVDNHQKWADLTRLEVVKKISLYSTKVIEDSRFNIPHRYWESQFSIPAIDVFRIHHLDNEAKMTSLKWCAFMMNMPVEEMPVPFWKKGLTQEDILEVQKYRRNDVRVTEAVLYITLGQVDKVLEINGGYPLEELKDYLGKNMIQDRFDVMKETGLQCLNYSDVKIGEEWNMLDYIKAEGVQSRDQLFPKKMKSIYGQPFKNFFPRTLEFTTNHLKKFIEQFGSTKVRKPKKEEKKQEFKVTVGKTVYTIAKGGIHSCEKNRKIIPAEGYTLRDSDVQSQYPNAIVKLEIFPSHLKITILTQYQGKIRKRVLYKNKAKELKDQRKEEESRIYTSVADMLKLCLNGGSGI